MQLRDVSLSPVVSEHCIVAIAEINLLYVVAPVDIFSVIATKLHIDVGDGGAFDALQSHVSSQPLSYMLQANPNPVLSFTCLYYKFILI